MRDSDELREHGLPVFAAAISPAGPSKGGAERSTELFPAAMSRFSPATLSSVMLTVLWLSPQPEQQAYATATERLAIEKDALARVEKGEDTAVIFGAPPIIDIDTEPRFSLVWH